MELRSPQLWPWSALATDVSSSCRSAVPYLTLPPAAGPGSVDAGKALAAGGMCPRGLPSVPRLGALLEWPPEDLAWWLKVP